MKCRINVCKVKYKFDDSEMYGIELRLAPKVKKFVQMNKDNRDLLSLMGNGIDKWYSMAEFGDDIDLFAEIPDNPREKIVVSVDQPEQPAEKIDTSNFWA